MPLYCAISRLSLEVADKKDSRQVINGVKINSLCLKVNKGFTLIEFLVVVGILTTVVGSTLLFLTSILRGSNQTNITNEVKQNGQVVFDSLDKQIRNGRNAVSIVPPTGSSSAIMLTLSDDSFLFLACFDTVPNTSNGWIGSVSSLTSSAPVPASYVPLTNQDKISGVDIKCDSSPGATFSAIPASAGSATPSIVKMGFGASQAVLAPSRSDFQANIRFDTTISLRQY